LNGSPMGVSFRRRRHPCRPDWNGEDGRLHRRPEADWHRESHVASKFAQIA
jgi:hypothetical protein